MVNSFPMPAWVRWTVISIWLSSIYMLWPLPGTMLVTTQMTAQEAQREAAKIGLPVEKFKELLLTQSKRTSQKDAIAWGLKAGVLALGLISAIAIFMKWRAADFLVWISSLTYLLLWLQGLGGVPFDGQQHGITLYISTLQITLMFNDPLVFIIFLHRDMILLVLHALLATGLPYLWMKQSSQQNGPASN